MKPTLSELRRLPKADLHSHIDGSVPAEELLAIAKRHRRAVSTRSGHLLRTQSELQAHVRGPGYHDLLEDIVERFHPIVGIMQTEEILREVGVAYAKGLRGDNVIYSEGRFAPQYHTLEGLTIEQAIASLADGLKEGRESYGVRVNLIVAIGRESTPRVGSRVARAASSSRNVAALDLGGPEKGNPPEKFREAFGIARAAGLKATVHAGEGAGSIHQNLKNIRTAVEVLGAHRLGHAIDLWRNKALVALIRERGVALEMNPVSNLTLRKISNFRDLHIDALLASGLTVTVNSDDPALWPHGTLSEVLEGVGTAYGFGFRELGLLVENSFRSSFASEADKRWMLECYSSARLRRPK